MNSLERLAAALADRYVIARELGAGGMATVYLAHDVRHDRDVAVKVLQPDLGAALGADRFLSEIKTTARLQHPHILPLLDSGDAGGLLYYVMPVVSGETLRERLKRERQLPIPEAVRIAREVAGALDYAHRHSVIHRDIKPENILLHDGQALVADFGIALAVQSAGGERLTQTGLSLGTPQYMSPEQAMGERTIDARSDVYALGAVTYEMLAGDPPFTGSSVQAIVAKVMAERPTPLSTLRDTVPPGLEAAVLTALAKLPADRFASAAAFAAALAADGPADRRTDGLRVASTHGPSVRRSVGPLVPWALLAITAGAAAWGWLRPAVAPPVVRYRIPLDSVPETRDGSGAIALSPDGSVLVHSGGLSGPLLVRRRDELAFTPLPGTEGARSPFFSPDGRYLGFAADNRLLVVPLNGGLPVVYLDTMVSWAPSWGADGYLYGLNRSNDAAGLGIWRMAARPGAPLEPVTTLDSAAGEVFHSRAELLPRGDAILFSIRYRDGRDAVAVADLRTGRHTVLVSGVRGHYGASGQLLYSTLDGKLWSVRFDAGARAVSGTPVIIADRLRSTVVGPVDFAVSANGTLAYVVDDASDLRELAWVSRDGRAQPVDSTWKGTFASPALSPDGSRLAVTVREATSADIWVQPVGGGPRSRVIFGTVPSESPAWTPDGRAISYIAGASTGDVWSRRVDGAEGPRRLLASARPISEQLWSMTGGWLVVRTTTPTPGAGDILALRPPGDSVPVPVVASRYSEYAPTLSPDGRYLAYVSDETGRTEVYVVPFPTPGTAKWQVSTRRGYSPRWSRRGGELFYIDGEANLVAAQVTTSPGFSLGRTTVLFSAAGFVSTGISRRNYDVSPDDQRFLMIRRARGFAAAQVVVVESWFAEFAAGQRGGR